MSDGDALLRAIIADPADDAVRLVYADWLDEHGDAARAEFIRVQIHLARELGHPQPPAHVDHVRDAIRAGRRDLLPLTRRERELLAGNHERWSAELSAGVSVREFIRGFPERLWIPWTVYVEHGARLFSRTPIESVELVRITERIEPVPGAGNPARWTDPGMAVAALAACPHLARLRRLRLPSCMLTAEHLVRLSQSPHMPELRELDLSGNRIGTAGLYTIARCARLYRLETLRCGLAGGYWMGLLELARSPYLGQLRELDLSANELGHQGLSALTAWPLLERLSLRRNGIQAEGLTRLGDAHLPRLAALDVGANHLGEAVAILARWAVTPQLTDLNLAANGLTPVGVGVLTESVAFGGLRELDLSGTSDTPQSVGPEGGVALGRSRLRALRTLTLDRTELGDAGLAGLADRSALSELESLSISGNGIGPADARALAQADKFARLRHLSIGSNPIGPTGMAALADSPRLANLRTFTIGECEIGDEGVMALLRAEWFANLADLNLQRNGLTDRAAIALAEHPHLQRLVRLNLSHNRIGDAGVTALARSPFVDSLTGLVLSHNAIGDVGCLALSESPSLGGLSTLYLDDNPAITVAGRRPLWQRFGRRLYVRGHTREEDERDGS